MCLSESPSILKRLGTPPLLNDVQLSPVEEEEAEEEEIEEDQEEEEREGGGVVGISCFLICVVLFLSSCESPLLLFRFPGRVLIRILPYGFIHR